MEKMSELMELVKKCDSSRFFVGLNVISGFGFDMGMRIQVYAYPNGITSIENRIETEQQLTEDGIGNAIDWLKEQYEVNHGNEE